MLVTLLAAAVMSPLPTGDVKLLRFPAIHGDKVVFTYASDLWLVDRSGGTARRLTSHDGDETRARFSPCGTMIAFTAQYDDPTGSVYVIPAEGGQPQRLTYRPVPEQVMGWTPDGDVAYMVPTSQPELWRLMTVSPDGGFPRFTGLGEIREGSFSPDGNQIAFQRRASHLFNWRRYRGGTQGVISFFNFNDQSYSQLPVGTEQQFHPMWVGDSVFFVSDRNQDTLNLYRFDTGNRRITQLTQFDDADIRWPSTDGETIIYERRGLLWTYDIASGNISQIRPEINNDLLVRRPQVIRTGDQIAEVSLSPSANRVAVQSRGEIFSLPARTGPTRNLTNTPGAREKNVAWSPDGTRIAYLSDESGEWQIMHQPQMGGEAVAVETPEDHRILAFGWGPKNDRFFYTTVDFRIVMVEIESGEVTEIHNDAYGFGGFDISPDGRWVAFNVVEDNLNAGLHLYNIETGRYHEILSARYNHGSVAFDLNGKYLYVISAREFQPAIDGGDIMLQTTPSDRVYLLPLTDDLTNPLLPPSDEEPAGNDAAAAAESRAENVRVEVEGMESRLIPLPWPRGSYGQLIGLNNGVLVGGSSGWQRFDLNTRASQTILALPVNISVNPSRSHLAYVAGGNVGISPLQPNIEIGAGRVNTTDVASLIDPQQEWEQIFWEVWRYQRDYFYDPMLLNLDWVAIGEQYAQLLPYVSHSSDLYYILGQLIGELGTGHAYTTPSPRSLTPQNLASAVLGADYRLGQNGYVQFERIYRGVSYLGNAAGPLAAPGVNVREGDYLLAIDGVRVAPRTDPHRLLLGKAGREVRLTVNSRASMTGAREVVVRPVSTDSAIRYEDYIERNRLYVEERSGGRIGYFHVPNTAIEGMIAFLRFARAQTDREAWIIDERWNGGGFIPTFFVEFLSRTTNSALRQRRGDDIFYPVAQLDGPKVMLINSYAGSGGDMLPWLFRREGLGPLIGTRTWGGLVGIQGSLQLMDGGSVTAPSFGVYDPIAGEFIAENEGVSPDIEVDMTPADMARGLDPQLTRGVDYLLDALERGQGRGPFRDPPFPRVREAG